MSILVVNSLKNSSGGSPTLTWPTTDGTDGQVLQSSNNAGNLIFGGAQLEAQNGTNITFPASAADDRTFVTDANGNLTATAVGTNPMNTPDNSHQGERLLDKYVISGGGTPASSINLTVPSGYTSTDLNTIRNFRIVITGLGIASGADWRALFTPLVGKAGGSANSNMYTAGSNYSGDHMQLGVEGKGSVNVLMTEQSSSQRFYGTARNVFRESNSASNNIDFFVNEATGGASNALTWNGSQSLLFGEVTSDCNSSPVFVRKMQYINNQNTGNYYDEMGMFPTYGTSLTDGNNEGRHSMGIKITNTLGVNFTTGFVEMYGMFKDGVVS